MYPDNERGGDVSNEKNLIPFNERTESEQREIAQKGGIASGAARRRKRSMRQAADYYLSLPETDRRRVNAMLRDQIDPEDVDNQMSVVMGIAEQAKRGNPQAAAVLLKMLGEEALQEDPGADALAKAKELLAQAGYPDGFDMTISVPNNYQPHMDTAEVVAEQLREAGINVTIQPVEWSTWLDTIYNGRQFQATVVGVDAANMTARAMLERFTSDYGKNFINYNNPAYDALFQQAINAQDEATQTDLYKQMETMLADTAANVYIQDLCDLVAMRQDLGGLKFYPIYVLDLSTVYLTQR